MAAPDSFAWSFRDVCAYTKEKAFFVAGYDKAAKSDLPGSGLFVWVGHWQSEAIPLDGTSIAAATFPLISLLIMGVDGRVFRWASGPASEEVIDSSENGPQNYGDLREIRTIDERSYIVGMRRTVYRCDGVKNWIRIDQGVRCSEDDESDAGFNSIHGFNESDIYAVGWDGEIWHWNGRKWNQKESPTNLALFRVVCSQDNQVYCCGQNGTIIFGREDTWDIMEHDETDETFWGATWFKGNLYLSTSNGIFILKKANLEPVEIKPKNNIEIVIEPNNCFYRLDANDEVLWSIGEKMVIFSEDGNYWNETPYE